MEYECSLRLVLFVIMGDVHILGMLLGHLVGQDARQIPTSQGFMQDQIIASHMFWFASHMFWWTR